LKLNRVVITGMGAVSPMGKGTEALMSGIRENRSGVRRMPGWEAYTGLRSLVGAPSELRDEKAIPRQKRRSMSPMSIFTVQAAEEALKESGLLPLPLDRNGVGCIVGSTIGSSLSINEFYEHFLPERKFEDVPSTGFFRAMSHTASMNLAQYLGLTGYVMATSAACASGLQAIGTGYQVLQLGLQDVLLCGGTEELHATVTGTFDLLYAATTGYNDAPELTPRPFDARRDGLVCGDGAGIVILETLDHARARGAPVLAEILGYHTTGSGEHISQSNEPAMVQCMKEVLRQAELKPGEVDYINAHATATLQGDEAEASAIAAVFGEEVPVSSLKGYIGHTLGASGAIELAATVRMMAEGRVYPTRNLQTVADDCKGIRHVTERLDRQLTHTLKNGFAFGGVNASIALGNIA